MSSGLLAEEALAVVIHELVSSSVLGDPSGL